MSIDLLIWLPAIHMNISELLNLLFVCFVVIVLKHINFLRVGKINNLLHSLLTLNLQANESFLLLVHDHGYDFDQLMPNLLVLLPFLDL